MAKLLANAIRSNTVNKLKGNFYDMDYHRIGSNCHLSLWR